MKKVLVGLVMLLASLVGSLGFGTVAYAYPEVPKAGTPQVGSSSPSTGATLPNTGGPNILLLGGAAVLIVAGGTTLSAVRRRETD